MSAKLRDKYISICRGEEPKYSDWLTPVYKGDVGSAAPVAAAKSAAK
jgi:hypothetical protein